MGERCDATSGAPAEHHASRDCQPGRYLLPFCTPHSSPGPGNKASTYLSREKHPCLSKEASHTCQRRLRGRIRARHRPPLRTYTVMAHIVMARYRPPLRTYVAMAHVVIAHIVMAYMSVLIFGPPSRIEASCALEVVFWKGVPCRIVQDVFLVVQPRDERP